MVTRVWSRNACHVCGYIYIYVCVVHVGLSLLDVCVYFQVKYFAVARGDVAGFIQFQTKLKSWDHAPGVLCVQESGGSALDANGDEVLFADRDFSVAKGIVCIAAEADTMTRQRLTACVQQTDISE